MYVFMEELGNSKIRSLVKHRILEGLFNTWEEFTAVVMDYISIRRHDAW